MSAALLRADVDDHRAGALRLRRGDRQLDQRFGLRARDQHVRRHVESSVVERALAEDVGHRLTGGAAFDQRGEAGLLRGGQFAFRMRDDMRAARVEHMRHQQLRVQSGRVTACEETGAGGGQQRAESGHSIPVDGTASSDS